MRRNKQDEGKRDEDIFISHHSQDLGFGNSLAESLKKLGHIPVMYHLKHSLEKDNEIFNLKLLNEEMRADFVVCVISQAYLEDTWLQRELVAFYSKEQNEGRVFAIPVLIGSLKDEDVPDELRERERADSRGDDFGRGLSQLRSILDKVAIRSGIDVFISHSSVDAEIAGALVDLLRAAINITSQRIRCTSVDGYRLPAGASTDDALKKEVYDADAFIGIITPSSVKSTYVMFELGARWGARRHLAPVLAAGARNSLLKGPLAGISTLSCEDRGQVQQLVGDVASVLGREKDSESSFEAKVERLLEVSRHRAQRNKLRG